MTARRFVASALCGAVLATAFAGAAAGQGQAGQARDAAGRPVTAGTGVITGTVVTDDTAAKPVRRATVALSAGSLGGPQITVTDDAGAFVFANLAAGNYTLAASRPGYVNGYYATKRPGRGPGTPVAVVAGQRVDGLQLRMMHGGVISGTIRTPTGVPIVGASVQVTERGANAAELFVQASSALVMTDDRGVYRAYGLRPGQYVVMARIQTFAFSQEVRPVTAAEIAWAEASASRAQATTRSAPPPVPPPAPPVTYAPTYYPGTVDSAGAGSITIGAAEERSGVDFIAMMVPTARVSGQLVGLDGQPVNSTAVQLQPIGSNDLLGQFGMGGSGGRTTPDGRFLFTNVLPGRYVISARAAVPRPGAPAAAAPSPQDAAMIMMAGMFGGAVPGGSVTLWAQQEVLVEGHDLSDITLRLQNGMTVSGKIVYDGSPDAPAADPARTRIMLMNLPSSLGNMNVQSMMTSMAAATTNADGTFQAVGVMPNQYRLQVMAPGMMLAPQAPQSSPGWVLKSVVLNGKDVADAPFDVKPGENVSGLVVTMTDRVSELSGRVVDANGRPAPGFPIVVFSTDRSTWTLGSRRVQQARPSTDGSYRVTALPAGDYYVCAVTELSPEDVYNPEYLDQLVAGSFKITLAAGEKRVQDLKLGGGQ